MAGEGMEIGDRADAGVEGVVCEREGGWYYL